MSETYPLEQTVKAKGLKCPMPVIKLQQAIRQVADGAYVAIETTDSGAPNDISKWAKVNKHKIIAVNETPDGHYFVLQSKGFSK